MNQLPFHYQWIILKNYAKLPKCQHAHYDSETEIEYFKSNQLLFSCFIGIKEFFCDIRKPSQNTHQRLLIEFVTISFFCDDVAHHGTENNSDFTHYRLHCFIDPV